MMSTMFGRALAFEVWAAAEESAAAPGAAAIHCRRVGLWSDKVASRGKNSTDGIRYALTMNRLKNKRALITGGTSGIGLETARLFLSEGARLAITGRNPATLEAARKELGADVLIIPSDASDVAAQKTIAETLRQAFGGLDVLFLNAGIAELKPVEQWDESAFDRSFATNLKGPFFLVQALLPIMATPPP
jgi:NADPH:quinone reductase-like Zn-dependent oxidoreductase